MTLKKNNFFILLLIIFEILYFKEFLFRPYDTPGQESHPSMASYLFAYGNIYRNDWDYLIPKYLNCNLEIIPSDAFWFNIYYLSFSLLVKVFGTDYIIGGLFPIFLNTVGLFLIFRANTDNKWLILSSLILLFCSTFKDSFAFNFHDSLMLFLIGLFFYFKKINLNNHLITLFAIFSILSLYYNIFHIFIFF